MLSFRNDIRNQRTRKPLSGNFQQKFANRTVYDASEECECVDVVHKLK